MFKFKKIKFKRIKTVLNKTPLALAGNYFSTFLAISFFSVILALVVFYQYGASVKNGKIDISEEVLQLNETAYQNILAEWQKRNQRFLETDANQYRDPFNEDLSQ